MRINDTLRNVRCPNEPEDKGGMLYSHDKHEVFVQGFRVDVTAKYLPNGRQHAHDRPEDTIRNVRSIFPLICDTCGAEAEVGEWTYDPVESEEATRPGWKQMAIE